MSKKILAVCVAALASLMGLAAVQASAATLETISGETHTPLLAIYGNPGSNGEAVPVGGGLGRNFGFGENMLFEASTPKSIGANLEITLENVAKTVAVAQDSYIGGTVASNKTGANNPLSFDVQFVDFQDSNTTTFGVLPSYADTADRPWIAEICPELAVTKECRVDPGFKGGRSVKIEDVSFNLGPGVVVQGDVWGEWTNGKAGEPPCIALALPPEGAGASETLAVTQTISEEAVPLGTKIEAIKGKACLISANNDWYKAGEEKAEPEIVISNK